MRKFLTILSLLITIGVVGQVTPKTPFNIPDNNTAFGINLPEGSYVYDVATDSVWVLNAVATTTTTLRTATKTLISPVDNSSLDHGELIGLTDDDHEQYALLDGRVGDKLTIDSIGSYNSSGNLYLAPNLYLTASEESGEVGEALITLPDYNQAISFSTANGMAFYSGVNYYIFDKDNHIYSPTAISLGIQPFPFGALYTTNITDDATNLKFTVPIGAYDSLLLINGTTVYKKASDYLKTEVDGVVGNEGDTTKHHTVGYGLDGTFYNQTANQAWKVDTAEVTTPYYVKDAIHDSLSDIEFNDLSDVNITGADQGDIPMLNETNQWIPYTPNWLLSGDIVDTANYAWDADKLDGQHGSYYLDNTDTQRLSYTNTHPLTLGISGGNDLVLHVFGDIDQAINGLVPGNELLTDDYFLDATGTWSTISHPPQQWTLTGNDIANNNSGKVTLPKDSTYFSGIPDEATKVERIAHINQYGKIEWVSPLKLYEEQLDTLAEMATPSAYGTWVRDTTNGELYPAATADKVGIGTDAPSEMLDVNGDIRGRGTITLDSLNGSAAGITINQKDSILQDLSVNTGTDYTFGTKYVALKFTASETAVYRAVGIRLKKDGTITNQGDYIQARIYSDNAGRPGTNFSFAWENICYGYITTSYAEYTVQVGQSGGITSGTSYWVVLQYNAAPSGGNIYIDTKNTGTALAATSANGSAWTPVNNVTGWLRFYYSENPSLSIKSKNFYGMDVRSESEYAIYAESLHDAAIYAKGFNQHGGVFKSVWGTAIYGTGYKNGVVGDATAGNGVWGSSTGLGHGVLGSVENASYSGVAGTNTTGYGVQGQSTSNYGVYGSSTSENGIYGTTAANNKAGVRGFGATGTGVIGASTSGYGSQFSSSSGYGSYIVSKTGTPLYILHYPAATNTLTQSMKISKGTSGTGAAGLGGSIDWYNQDAGGGEELEGRIGTIQLKATNGSERGALVFYTKGSDGVLERMRIDSAGCISNPNGSLTFNDQWRGYTGIIADNDSTPSFAGGNTFVYAGSSHSVSIDAIDDHVVGCYYTIIGNSNTYTITVIDGTPAGGDSFDLSGGSFVGGLNDVLVLYCIAADTFVEVSRSDN